MNSTRRFTYPPAYRFIYLWLPHIVAGGLFFSYVWTFSVLAPGLSMVISVGISLGIALAAFYIAMRRYWRVPISIEIGSGRISLWRREKYREIKMADIVDVRRHSLIAGGWTKVSFRADDGIDEFHVAPVIRDYNELVDILSCCKPQP